MKAYIVTLLAVVLLVPALSAKELKIDDVVVDDGLNGTKALHVPIVHLTDDPVAVKDVKVVVYFYEVKDDKIELAPTPVISQWNSAPVDWKDTDTEDVTFGYPGPKGEGKSYIGAIVGVYYKNKLEDVWASAPELLKQFPVAAERK